MDWQGLERQLQSDHSHEPQVLARVNIALAAAREALQILAGHGHSYHLVAGVGEKFPEWPRKLYHVDLAANGRTVYTEWEAKDLGPGWFDSLQKAQFWDGLETQFNGRGGVPKTPRTLAPTSQPITISEEEMQRLEDLKAEILEFRTRNKWESSDAKQIGEAAPAAGANGAARAQAAAESLA